ncbi:hypothetical protein FOMA001_g19533 [Fusarium oxysporum f. sp. matthiolae]|nr:hypothetical protein FOMA001_g19533 [Fusarium oxysporum f. sp. matthiolae]
MAPTRTKRPTPSRKKSCLPCARSKVRCDLERLSCARCVASNRPCRYATADGPSSPAAPRHVVAPTSNATPASLSAIFTGPAEADYVEPCVTRQTPAPTQDITPQTCHLTSLNFSHLDLVPLADADQIRDRWLRPFLDVGDRVPKAFHPYTLQYMSCVLRTYPKQMAGDDVPPTGLKATPPNPRSGSTRGFHCPLHWQNPSGLANPPNPLGDVVDGLGGLEVG